jgi:hypothetical protein
VHMFLRRSLGSEAGRSQDDQRENDGKLAFHLDT